MDDLLTHSAKKYHWILWEDLLRAMIKNGLKLSPKKCQLFRTTLTYMGSDFKKEQDNDYHSSEDENRGNMKNTHSQNP